MALSDAAPFAISVWPLDEASGSALDSVGSNDLTDNNTVGSAGGKLDNARDFEVSNGEVFSLAHASMNPSLSLGDTDWMVRFWVRFESLSTSGAGNILVMKGRLPDNPTNFEWSITSGGVFKRATLLVSNGSAITQVNTASNSLVVDTWYLVHAWHDAANNEIGISLDAGTAVTASYSNGVHTLSSRDFALGAGLTSVGGAVSGHDGLIDDCVVLQGYILDTTERTEDYNSGAGVAFADWAGGGGGSVVPLDEGMLRGGLHSMSGGLA